MKEVILHQDRQELFVRLRMTRGNKAKLFGETYSIMRVSCWEIDLCSTGLLMYFEPQKLLQI